MRHEQSETGKNCVTLKKKSPTGEEGKTKTLQQVKVQHEIMQYIKRV